DAEYGHGHACRTSPGPSETHQPHVLAWHVEPSTATGHSAATRRSLASRFHRITQRSGRSGAAGLLCVRPDSAEYSPAGLHRVACIDDGVLHPAVPEPAPFFCPDPAHDADGGA